MSYIKKGQICKKTFLFNNTNIKFTTYKRKSIIVKRFSENIDKLQIGRNIINLNITFLKMISKKVISNLNVLGLTTVSYTHLTLPTKRIV